VNDATGRHIPGTPTDWRNSEDLVPGYYDSAEGLADEDDQAAADAEPAEQPGADSSPMSELTRNAIGPVCVEHGVLLNPSGFCPVCDARTLAELQASPATAGLHAVCIICRAEQPLAATVDIGTGSRRCVDLVLCMQRIGQPLATLPDHDHAEHAAIGRARQVLAEFGARAPYTYTLLDGTPATYSAKPGDGTLDLWNACRLGEMASVLGNLLAHLDATDSR
jgi:hypothetical protein